jgi:DNA repair protein SbcD/Mre11
MLKSDDALGSLLRAIRDLETDAQLLARLGSELHDLQRRLPSELRAGDDGIDLGSPQLFRQALEDVKHRLLARLLARRETL